MSFEQLACRCVVVDAGRMECVALQQRVGMDHCFSVAVLASVLAISECVEGTRCLHAV